MRINNEMFGDYLKWQKTEYEKLQILGAWRVHTTWNQALSRRMHVTRIHLNDSRYPIDCH